MQVPAGSSWEETIADMRVLAKMPDGLFLVFLYGPGELAVDGLRQVEEDVRAERPVRWHRLHQDGGDLTVSLAVESPTALLVHGLECLAIEERRHALSVLNTGRNALARFDALIVFWIPEDERDDVFRLWPDLLHWRTVIRTVTAGDVDLYRHRGEGRDRSRPNVDALIRSLNPQNQTSGLARRDVVRTLGRIRDPAVLEALIRSLDPETEPDGTVRGCAAGALGEIGSSRAVDVLVRSLDPRFEHRADARGNAATALGRIGGPKAREALARSARPVFEAHQLARRAAARALASIDSEARVS